MSHQFDPIDERLIEKMRQTCRANTPSSSELLQRFARYQARKNRSRSVGRALRPMALAALCTLLLCGSALAWGIHAGVVQIKGMTTPDQTESEFTSAQQDLSSAQKTTSTSASAVLEHDIILEKKAPQQIALDVSAAPGAPIAPGKEHAEEATRPSMRSGTKLKAPASALSSFLEPDDVPSRLQGDLQSHNDAPKQQRGEWRVLADAMRSSQFETAENVARTIAAQSDGAEREAALVLSLQLKTKHQSLSSSDRLTLERLATSGSSSNIRSSAERLLTIGKHKEHAAQIANDGALIE